MRKRERRPSCIIQVYTDRFHGRNVYMCSLCKVDVWPTKDLVLGKSYRKHLENPEHVLNELAQMGGPYGSHSS